MIATTLARLISLWLPISMMACGGEPFSAMDGEELASGGSVDLPRVPHSVGAAAGSSANAGQTSGGAGNAGNAGNAAGGVAAAGSGSAVGGGGIVEAPGGAGGSGPSPSFALVDDAEGDFPALPSLDGRRGGWYTVTDDSSGQASGAELASFEPVSSGNRFAVHVRGGGFTGWGFQLGVSLTSPVVGYDASRYCGVRFLAKGSGPAWTLLLSDRQSVPQGGVCESTGACNRFVGAPFTVDGEWREVSIPFAALRLQDEADPRRLDPSAIYDILFHFQSQVGSGFELFVDDLGFVEQISGRCVE